MSRDDATLLDILRAARLALEFRGEADRPAFLSDLKTQAAVLHELLVLGEAVKRLSPSFRERHPAVPWRAVARMRDRLLHGYDDVDLELVWRTLEEDLPGADRSTEGARAPLRGLSPRSSPLGQGAPSLSQTSSGSSTPG